MRQGQGQRLRIVAVALVIAVAWQGGCRQLDRPSRDSAHAWEQGTEPSRITKAQEADLHVSIGRSAESRSDVATALAAYEEATRRDPSRADAYLRMAILHDQKGEYRESAKLYQQALQVDPKNADIYCDLGYSLYLQRRWADAERNLRQALALQGDHARSHNNLGLVLAQNGQPEKALTAFLKGGNNQAQARGNLAFALSLDGRWDEARTQYQVALASDVRSETTQARLQELDALIAQRDNNNNNKNPNGQAIPKVAPLDREILPTATLQHAAVKGGSDNVDPFDEILPTATLQHAAEPATSLSKTSKAVPALLNLSPQSLSTDIPPPREP